MSEFDKLIYLMKRLRGPNGCPWDREQTLEKLKPYLIEESYEVLDAIDNGIPERIKEELGDLLFQIMFISEIFEEKGHFNINDVINNLFEKMVRRHPHVFSNISVRDSNEVLKNWSRIKEEEGTKESILDGIPNILPSLLRAHRIGEKASMVGFDWDNKEDVYKKVEEEMEELKNSISYESHERIEEEFGDLLFAIVNLGRFLKINSEEALRKGIERFIDRFRYIEKKIKEDRRDIRETSIEEMEKLWNESKRTIDD